MKKVFALLLMIVVIYTTIPVSNGQTLEPAEKDCKKGGAPNLKCPIWVVTIKWTWSGPEVSCTTGGEYTCDPDVD